MIFRNIQINYITPDTLHHYFRDPLNNQPNIENDFD